MGAHETIMRLRKEFNIPEEPISKEDEERERREREARAKRLELAETEEGYVKMFNRDPWTDEWLGPGPELPMPFLEDNLPKKEQKKAMKERQEREHQEFIEKMGLNNKQMYQRANWFLQEYAAPWYKDKIMKRFDYDIESIVIFCNEQVEALEFLNHWEEVNNKDKRTDREKMDAIEARKEERELGIEVRDGIRWEPVNVAYSNKKEIEIDMNEGIPDIPNEHWDEFSKWEKKNPMKKFKNKARKWRCSEITARRIVFLKMINSRNKKWRKNMVMRDPLTGMTFLSEKKLKEV